MRWASSSPLLECILSAVGFAPGGAARERDLEQRFDAQLSAAEMRGWLQQLSSAPNQVGSPHDKANAEFLLAE